jgi:hypothetical protein
MPITMGENCGWPAGHRTRTIRSLLDKRKVIEKEESEKIGSSARPKKARGGIKNKGERNEEKEKK